MKYDVLIASGASHPKCFLPIAKEFDIPIIAAVTMRSFSYSDKLFANPRSPAEVPFEFTSFYTEQSFWNRLMNSFNEIVHRLITHSAYDKAIQDPRFQKYFPNFDESQTQPMSLLLYNTHHSIFSRPLTPNTIELGGLHISPVPNALPEVNNFLIFVYIFIHSRSKYKEVIYLWYLHWLILQMTLVQSRIHSRALSFLSWYGI